MGTVHYPIKDGHISSLYAAFAVQTCGCKVDGTGTLQHPLHTIRCPLHAAAPEMLEALQTITQAVDDTAVDGISRFACIARTAHAAIAKAKGDELCG